MTDESRQLHWIVDRPLHSGAMERSEAEGANDSGRPGTYATLPLAQGLSFLSLDSSGNPVVTRDQLPRERPTLAVEPLRRDSNLELLLLNLSYPAESLRLNGQPVPRVGLLGVGDQLCLGGGTFLHLTLYHRPAIGPASEEQTGQPCLFCRVPFASEDTVYGCPCGARFHVATNSVENENERLECVKLISECNRCSRPIVLEEGFAHVPDLD